MKKEYKNNTKVFFSVNNDINEKFENFCENNYMNKSKLIEGLMKLIIQNPDVIITLLKEQ